MSAERTLRSAVPTQSATTIPGPSAANVKTDISLEAMEGAARVRESLVRFTVEALTAETRFLTYSQKKKREHCFTYRGNDKFRE